MSTVTFSIVTPSFNQGKFIEATIKSILDQAGDFKIQYIIADAGSTDQTVEIIKKYEQQLKAGTYPLKCKGATLTWWSRKDKGQPDAINQGFEVSTGDIWAYLNSDDIYFPGAFESARLALEKYPEAGMVYSDFVDIDADGKELEKHVLPEFDFAYVANGNIIGQPATFMLKAALDDVGVMDLNYHYALDYDLWLRIGSKYPIQYVPACWAGFRLHGDSKTVAQSQKFYKEEREISRKYGGKYFSRLWAYNFHSRYPSTAAAVFKTGRTLRMISKGEWAAMVAKIKKNAKGK